MATTTNLAQTTDQLVKIIERLNNSAGSLVRSTQSISEALLDTSDKFKKARLEDIVEKSAKKMGKSFDKADNGLLKFVKALNDQVQSYKNVQTSLKLLKNATTEQTQQFVKDGKEHLAIAKANGDLQKILGIGYERQIKVIDNLIAKTQLEADDIAKLSDIFEVYGPKFAQTIKTATKELEHFDQATKTISLKEALGDALSKRGGIVGAITDSMRGSKGWANLTNFMKGSSIEMLFEGASKAVQQLIDASNEYDKTGVAPLVGASTQLVMQMSDLQKIMAENKETVFALQGGATAFTDTMIKLRGSTLELAGKDPILSGKLAAGAMDLTTTMASTTLTTGEMQARTTRYIADITKLRRATNMTAEEIENWDKQILDDEGIRSAMVRSTETERAQIIENIHARTREFQAMGISIARSKELAVSFEKLKKESTPLQRLRGSVRLSMMAAMLHMSSADISTAAAMSNKSQSPEQDKKNQDFMKRFETTFKETYNDLDNSSAMMAGTMQEMHDTALKEFGPNMIKVTEALGTAGIISGGKAQKPGAEATIDAKTDLQQGMLQVGKIAAYSRLIYEFLSQNGLKDLLMGGLGLALSTGFGAIIGALSSLAVAMKVGGGIGAAEGAAGAAGGLKAGLGRAGIIGAVGVGLIAAEEMFIDYKNKQQDEETTAKMKGPGGVLHTDTYEELAARLHAKGQLTYKEKQAQGLVAPGTGGGEEAAVSSAATAGTGTNDPMTALLLLQQQSKKILEEISKGISSLVDTYNETEAEKMQRLSTNSGSVTRARAYAQ